MKFYIVSESELETWADINEKLGECRTSEEVSRIKDEHIRAEAACRAREVPAWATHYVRDLEGPLDYGLYCITGSLEIKR